MKILIVDDSITMRRVVQKTLRQANFGKHEFVEAEDGEQAFEMVKKSPPDLILSDWNMPKMKGIEFLKKLRDEKIMIPFGFLTSEGTQEMRNLAGSTGALFLLVKPFTAEDLATALKTVIK